MAKKKNSRQKHQKEVGDPNTSDDEGNGTNNKGCPHASRAINLNKIKKYLKTNPDIEKCVSCLKNPSKNVAGDDDNDVLDSEIWLCLQCGNCGCGRNSPSQHAIAHHKTPHSDSHTIVLNTTSMSVWCYECDDEIQHRTSRIIRECVDLVKKAVTVKKPNIYMNGSVPEVSTNNAVNDTMTNQVVDTEPISPVPCTKNVVEESAKPQLPRNIKKQDQNICKGSIKGLRNLGNTCFFNAVMQNLSQTPWLLSELEKRSEKGYNWEIPFPVNGDKDLSIVDDGIKPLKVSLGDCFPLAQSLQILLKQMNSSDSQSKKSEVLNPGTLFEQICKKSPQFRGFQQQDSHELLRHLLDGVRNEEIRRQKRGILKALNLEKVDRNTADEETKQTVKAYGIYASHTIVEKIFGGQLLSTVVCEECKVSSQVFEPFMDLSLPLAEEKPMRANKGHKHDVTEDCGMQRIGKAKESDNRLSKHQERKMRQQARKTAKRQARLSKTKNVSPVLNEESAVGNVENDGELPDPDPEQKVESNNGLSDADIEDNEDSESVSCKLPVASEKEVKVNGSDEDVCEETMSCTQEMVDDRLQELCSQITDIRIRRDSDRQENFLENLDSPTGCASVIEENGVHHSASDNENNHVEGESWVHSQPDQLKKEWLLKSLTTLQPRYQPSAHECSVNSCLNQFTAPELLTGSNKFRCENCTTLRQNATGNKSEVVYSNASKQLLIFSPPAVLTLHLKRFQQTGMSLRKLNLFVEFPRVLDLAPYCSSVCVKLPHMAGVKDELLYSLYGIVQHSGRLTSGHYTAYVRLNKNYLNPAILNNWPMGQCSLDQLLDKIRKVQTVISENANDVNETTNENKNVWYYVSDGHFSEVSEADVFKCQAYILFYERIK